MAELDKLDTIGNAGHVKLKMPRGDIMAAMVAIVAQLNRDAKQMQSIVNCFDKCGFALTSDVPDESLGVSEEVWMSQLPKFSAWIASLSEKSL